MINHLPITILLFWKQSLVSEFGLIFLMGVGWFILLFYGIMVMRTPLAGTYLPGSVEW